MRKNEIYVCFSLKFFLTFFFKQYLYESEKSKFELRAL